jgi:hypothetical protein
MRSKRGVWCARSDLNSGIEWFNSMPKPAKTSSKKRTPQARAAPSPSPSPPAYFEDTGRTLADGRKLWRPLPALDALPKAERDALLAEKQGTILYEVKADNYTLGPLDFGKPSIKYSEWTVLLMTAHDALGITPTAGIYPKIEVAEDYFKRQRLSNGSLIKPAAAKKLATFCRPVGAMNGGRPPALRKR